MYTSGRGNAATSGIRRMTVLELRRGTRRRAALIVAL
jgi:hypothetical protein